MTGIQTIVVEPGTPELAICARWRVTAFSVLQASFEEELRSLELANMVRRKASFIFAIFALLSKPARSSVAVRVYWRNAPATTVTQLTFSEVPLTVH